MKAWIYQDDHQVKKHGAENASWYVGWLDPEGKRRCQSCGPGTAARRQPTSYAASARPSCSPALTRATRKRPGRTSAPNTKTGSPPAWKLEHGALPWKFSGT